MNQTIAKFILAANLALLSTSAFADDIMVMNATAHPSHVKEARTGTISLSIMNHGAQADQLVGITTDVAETAELHETQNVDGVFKMRSLEKLDIPAGATVDISKSTHIMLFGLTRELKKDDGFQITLDFAQSSDVVVNVAVGDPTHLDHAQSQ